MEEASKTYSSLFLSDKYVKAANVLEKAKGKVEYAKGKIESALHSERTHHRTKETHGFVENTPLTDVKAPNVFERVKEEIEALGETIYQKKESDQADGKRDEPTKEEPQTEKSDKYVKAANVLEKAKGKIESALHSERTHHRTKETHGFVENTPLTDVKSPNMFERVEEIEAFGETINQKKESDQDDGKRDEPTKQESQTEKSDVNVSNLIDKAEEKVPDLIEKGKGKIESAVGQHDQKETHGLRDDINENVPISEVKGPNVLERVKEEFEAAVETIHVHKEPVEPVSSSSNDEENGFWCSIGKWLEKICSPKPLEIKRD